MVYIAGLPKVCNHRHAVVREQDVAWLDIKMHSSRTVDCADTCENLSSDHHSLRE